MRIFYKLNLKIAFIVLCLNLLIWTDFVQSQTSRLTIDKIMEGQNFVGYSPENVFWAEDGTKIYFNWNPEREANPSMYALKIQNGKAVGNPAKVSEEEIKNLPNRFANYNRTRTQKIYSKNGDIFWLKNGRTQQITNTLENENNPNFSGDEKSIIFQKENNLFSWNSETGSITQLTDFKTGSEEKAKPQSAEDKWLENQQLSLIQIVKERKEQADRNKKITEARRPKRPKTYYLQGKNLDNLIFSPNQDFITFRLVQNPTNKNTLVPNYTTQSGFTENINARTKVGSPQNTYQMGVYNLVKDTIYLLDMSQLEGIYNLPEYYKEYKRELKDKKPREVIPNGVFWSDNGKSVVLNIRSQDSKDRWLVLLDPQTGKFKQLDHQRDEAWIGGPGIDGFLNSPGNVGWLPDNEHFYFQSEKTGYSHLYLINVNSNKITPLTSGKFEIREAILSLDKKRWYLISNEIHPGEYQYYTMALLGGVRTRITTQTGMYQVIPSPDEKYLAMRYSYSNQPWELYLKENKANAPETRLTNSQTTDFKAYSWRDPQVISFKAQDGTEVFARIYRPQNPEKQGKAVIFVHGAGYLQNAHKGWSSYFREYMFHNFLVEQGYTVLDIDYRASDGYGRDVRTGIYRYMGGKDLSDHVDGAKLLIEKYDISPQKIGIYGGSYGGFITLMAMFNHPDVFKAGAALRSVTDWAHYNHPYTANILNTPVLDSLAYARSSPINFAEGLKGKLLICHGMIDDNVHFQDVVRLAQRLIELRKENWEFAVYPLESHGFVEATSWADEYKRIFKLFEESLR